MDGLNSRKSDAGATRKRRSSILKSQRAPRAPLSELEFNVATPQDHAKSRRVSFSRRTGVAEFEINEATTAWKNVYEEHNKSLETSGLEAGAKGARPRRVAHLAARAARQFCDDEAEAEDTGREPGREPGHLPEHNTVQLFRLDANPAMRDLTDQLDLDFSAVAPLTDADADDLDALQRDLERDRDYREVNMSEYSIDVDFNSTHVSLKAEESGTDMSITDTIRSPQVTASAPADERKALAADWVAEKENILMNPYVAPPPADFANDDCDDVLVFDGKKCKFQSNLDLSDDECPSKQLTNDKRKMVYDDTACGDASAPQAEPARVVVAAHASGACARPSDVFKGQPTLGDVAVPESEPATDEHGTMFFDDIADITVTEVVPVQILQQKEPKRRRTVVFENDDGHISMTEAIAAQILQQKEPERRRTIVYDNDNGHISMTEAISAQILQQKEPERRRTIVYNNDDGHISMTETIPAQILQQKEPERRRTIVYENDDGHISMTETIPAQILQQKEPERRRTVVYDKDDGHISMTEAVPPQILQQIVPELRRTVVYDKDDGHVSMTEAVPPQILQQMVPELRRTVVYDKDDGHISMTEAVPPQILQQMEPERRRTVVYDKDDGHISMTEAVPAQILQQIEPERRRTIVYDNDDGHISMTEAIPAQILQLKEPERRRTIVYDNEDGHISMTEAIPAQILQLKEPERRRTIVYDNEDGHISMTEAIPAQILQLKEPERRRTIVYDNEDGHISMTEAIPAQILQLKEPERRRTIVYDNEDGHISMTETIPVQLQQQKESDRSKTIGHDNDEGLISMKEAIPPQILQQKDPERRRTIVYDKDDGHISMTETIPAQLLQQKDSVRRKTIVYDSDYGHISMTETIPVQLQQQKESDRSKTIGHDNDEGQKSMMEAIPPQILQQKDLERRKTVVYNYDDGHISITETVPAQNLQEKECERRTAVYENNNGHTLITEAVPTQILQQQESERRTVVYENDAGHKSMTEAILAQILQQQESIVRDKHDGRVSPTWAMPELENDSECRSNIIYDKEQADISATQAVATNITNGRSLISANDHSNLCAPQAAPGELILSEPAQSNIEKITSTFLDDVEHAERARTLVHEDGDVSVCENGANLTEPIGAAAADGAESQPNCTLGKIIVYEDSEGDISMNEVQLNTKPALITTDKDTASATQHAAPAVEPDDDSARDVMFEDVRLGGDPDTNLSRTLNRSPLDKLLVYETGSTGSAFPPGATLRPDAARDMPSRRLTAEGPWSPRSTESGESPASSPDRASGSSGSATGASSPRRAPPDRAAVLDALLDMSRASADDVPRARSPSPARSPARADSDTTITNAASDENLDSKDGDGRPGVEEAAPPPPPPLEYRRERRGVAARLKRGLGELKGVLFKGRASAGRDDASTPIPADAAAARAGADDTRALLDALSELTDSRRSGDFAAPGPGPAARRSAPLALEHRPRRSLARSREDLLADISLARAMMRPEGRAEDGPAAEPEPRAPFRGEAVRTLVFEDSPPGSPPSPPGLLHKPAASPPSPLGPRATVIPPYLRDVSDNVKELMEELMKPMADEVGPFRAEGAGRREARSSQVQADLLPSSQIDLLPAEPVVLRPSCLRARRAASPASPPPRPPPPPPAAPAARPRSPAAAPLVVFDHDNPLNNVALPPAGAVAHGYAPAGSAASLSPSLASREAQTEAPARESLAVECGVALLARRDRAASPAARAAALRDTEANTAIAMKGNRELLAGSSSLTLVDDALTRSVFDVSVSPAPAPPVRRARSPVRVIFKLEEPYSSVRLDSELTSHDDDDGPPDGAGLKRAPAEECSPKPPVKVQKLSNSSKVVRRLRSLQLSPPTGTRRGGGGGGAGGRGSTVTVQQLLSQPHAVGDARRDSDSSGAASLGSGRERTDWSPDLLHDLSSKDLVTECDSSANVVAKIDVLPFMGTSECEWESRASDTWSFRLLRARLRLVVQLEHRAANDTRALVRADTPVRRVLVQHAPVDHERDSPLAALCLCLAAAALQRLAGGAARAGAVPALLRRGAAVARVALRWGRAMRAAQAQLAFSLTDSGELSLKVANIPLRSVWEVRLRVELAAARGCPWPRAAAARAAPVVAAWTPPPAELARLLDSLPQDWGHVPRAVWKIFKYLKNKRPEDDLLCA